MHYLYNDKNTNFLFFVNICTFESIVLFFFIKRVFIYDLGYVLSRGFERVKTNGRHVHRASVARRLRRKRCDERKAETTDRDR